MNIILTCLNELATKKLRASNNFANHYPMRSFVFMMVALLIAVPALAAPALQSKANLTILADEAMLLPLAHIARDYANASQTPLTIVVKNAQTVQQQIEQGLEAHVIITADTGLVEQLTGQGLTDVLSRKAIAQTQLALVTASNLDQQANLAKRISFAAMLAATTNYPIFTTNADSIEGMRAKQLLASKQFAPGLAGRIQTKATHDEVLASLRDGPSLGLILAADAVGEADITVLSLLSDDLSPEVTYDAVVLGSKFMSESKAFANYLSSPVARAVFKQFGYQSPRL